MIVLKTEKVGINRLVERPCIALHTTNVQCSAHYSCQTACPLDLLPLSTLVMYFIVAEHTHTHTYINQSDGLLPACWPDDHCKVICVHVQTQVTQP